MTYFDEDVRGVVIGDVTATYEFWTRDDRPRRFARGAFPTDAHAEAWVREHHPEEYAAGVEMRVFDVPDHADIRATCRCGKRVRLRTDGTIPKHRMDVGLGGNRGTDECPHAGKAAA